LDWICECRIYEDNIFNDIFCWYKEFEDNLVFNNTMYKHYNKGRFTHGNLKFKVCKMGNSCEGFLDRQVFHDWLLRYFINILKKKVTIGWSCLSVVKCYLTYTVWRCHQ
jgi:hypothetical protein